MIPIPPQRYRLSQFVQTTPPNQWSLLTGQVLLLASSASELEALYVLQTHYWRQSARPYLWLAACRKATPSGIPELFFPMQLQWSLEHRAWRLSPQFECSPVWISEASEAPSELQSIRYDWLNQQPLDQTGSGSFLEEQFLLQLQDLWLVGQLVPTAVPAIPVTAKPPPTLSFPLFAVDPYQQRANELFQKHGKLQVIGGSKQHWLVQQLLQSAERKQAVLVIGPSIVGLQRLQTALSLLGLQPLSFIYSGSRSNRQLLAQRLSHAPRTKTTTTVKDPPESPSRLFQRLRAAYNHRRAPRFGDASWLDILGLYLPLHERQKQFRLSRLIGREDVVFDPPAYREALQQIRQTARLFQDLPGRHPAIELLNAGIFIHQSESESLEFIRRHTQELHTQFIQLRDAYLRLFSRQEEQLLRKLWQRYLAYEERIQELAQALQTIENSGIGTQALRSHPLTLQVLGLFNRQARRARSLQRQLQQKWQQFRRWHQEQPAFPFPPFQTPLPKEPAAIRKRFQQFQQALQDWSARWNTKLQEECLRLNQHTITGESDLSEKIKLLEKEHQQALTHLNDSGLFQLPLEGDALTLNRQLKQVELILDQLQTVSEFTHQYPIYYQWQRHWFQLPARIRRIGKALFTFPTDEWEALFSTWYFYQALEKYFQPSDLAKPKEVLHAYGTLAATYRQDQPRHLLQSWLNQRKSIAAKLQKWTSQSEALLLPLDQQAPPKELLQDIPIWLATPEAAGELIRAQLPFGQYYLNDIEALPAIWQSEDTEGIRLQTASIHRKGFRLNTIHHQGLLRPLIDPAQITQPLNGLHLIEVDSHYDASRGVNEAEAREILTQLNEIELLVNREYPRVGIVCMTKAQRTELQRLLWQIKTQQLEAGKRIAQMERNGLRICWIGELWGYAFDILIVSGVFGPVNARGVLPDGLEAKWSLVQPEALLELIYQPARQLYLFHSLPTDYLNNCLLSDGLSTSFLWAALLRLAAFEQDADQKGRKALLAEFHQRLELPTSTPHRLYQFLQKCLQKELTAWYWQVNYSTPHGTLPLVGKQADRKVAILLDGFLGLQAAFSADWEFEQQQQFKAAGWQLIATASSSWWLEPNEAVASIAEELHLAR